MPKHENFVKLWEQAQAGKFRPTVGTGLSRKTLPSCGNRPKQENSAQLWEQAPAGKFRPAVGTVLSSKTLPSCGNRLLIWGTSLCGEESAQLWVGRGFSRETRTSCGKRAAQLHSRESCSAVGTDSPVVGAGCPAVGTGCSAAQLHSREILFSCGNRLPSFGKRLLSCTDAQQGTDRPVVGTGRQGDSGDL